MQLQQNEGFSLVSISIFGLFGPSKVTEPTNAPYECVYEDNPDHQAKAIEWLLDYKCKDWCAYLH
jgi:hypothetical protein